jgi:hypothetical protein
LIAGKWLELLKEIAPRVAWVVFLFNPGTAPFAKYYDLHIDDAGDVAARPRDELARSHPSSPEVALPIVLSRSGRQLPRF